MTSATIVSRPEGDPQSKMEWLRRILFLALPNIISNITVPLISLANTSIAGHMASTTALASVAVAVAIVNVSYYLFGFLRMATTGLTAQAYGRDDRTSIARQWAVGTTIALLGGLLLISARPLFYSLSTIIDQGGRELSTETIQYIDIAYIGAPAALLLFVYNGWFSGMQNTVTPMVASVVANICNVAISATLVFSMGMGVEGLAWGMVSSQYLAVTILLGVALKQYSSYLDEIKWRDFFALEPVFNYIRIGKYLIFRTLALSSVTLFFVRIGGIYGQTTIAANSLLMQFFTTFAYFMDGFAYAGEALTGRYYGSGRRDLLAQMLRVLFSIGAVLAPSISLCYFLFPETFLSLLTDKSEVIEHALSHSLWLVLVPLVSFAAFLWDGVYVGLTQSRTMAYAVLISIILFYLCYFLFSSWLGEDALWIAFIAYLSLRTALLYYWGRSYLSPTSGNT